MLLAGPKQLFGEWVLKGLPSTYVFVMVHQGEYALHLSISEIQMTRKRSTSKDRVNLPQFAFPTTQEFAEFPRGRFRTVPSLFRTIRRFAKMNNIVKRLSCHYYLIRLSCYYCLIVTWKTSPFGRVYRSSGNWVYRSSSMANVRNEIRNNRLNKPDEFTLKKNSRVSVELRTFRY
jgi:hypothetical protein